MPLLTKMRSNIKKGNMPNKLNIGCGFDYRKGYLNIDFYNKAVADKTMSAAALNLPEKHFNEIMTNDVIEHLGYCATFFFLAKSYLSLKNNGTIVIKTPDIDKSIMQYNAAQSHKEKENILCWIYGTEDPGMYHKFCFPNELLKILLKKNGYTILRQTRQEEEKFRPYIHIIASKINNYFFQNRNKIIISIQKSDYIKIKYADFPYFENILESFLNITQKNDFMNLIKNYKIISPKLLLFFLKKSSPSLKGILSAKNYQKTIKELKTLANINYFKLLESFIIKKPYCSYEEILRELSRRIESGFLGKEKQIFKWLQYQTDFFTKENYYNFIRYVQSMRIKHNFIK